jgi:hypothetical protein
MAHPAIESSLQMLASGKVGKSKLRKLSLSLLDPIPSPRHGMAYYIKIYNVIINMVEI